MRFTLDGVEHECAPGLTVAEAMRAVGVRTWGERRPGRGQRGVYCTMGVCHGCLVELDGVPRTRACLAPIADGAVVRTAEGPTTPA